MKARYVIRLNNPEVIMYNGYLIQPTPKGYFVYAPIDTVKPIGRMVNTMDDALDYIEWLIWGDEDEEC